MNNNEIKNKIKKFPESKALKNIIYVLGVLIIIAIIFQAGVFVGFNKASFGRDWEEHYTENFGMMHRGSPLLGSMYNGLPNANGANGKIIKVELPTIIVLSGDNTEKVVLTSNDTKIRTIKGDGVPGDFEVGDYVVVIGSPNNQGQIDAKFIRVLPNQLPTPLSPAVNTSQPNQSANTPNITPSTSVQNQ